MFIKFKKFLTARLSMLRTLIIIILCLSLFNDTAFAAKRIVRKSQVNNGNIDNMIKSQKKAKADIDKKIKQYNEVAKKKAQESQNLLGQLTKLKRDANESQEQIDKLEGENKKLEASIKSLNKNIDAIHADMEVLLVRLRKRVLSMYKYSSQENLHLLFSSQTTHDALITAYNLSHLMDNDKHIVDELLSKSLKLNQSRAELEHNIAKVKNQSDELKKKQNDFDATIKNTNTLLKDIQSEHKKALTAAQELENSQKEIGNRILALTRQRIRQIEQEAKKSQANNSGKNKGKGKDNGQSKKSSSPSNIPARSLKAASLEWPVRGKISAPFGSRIHPVFKTKVFNSGIDIKAASGAPVKAAASGEVLYNGWIRGFGQVVILDHGGNVSTVYAHLASASVREGDSVKAGSVLGTVGNSGTDAEYALHFEVRRGGSAQNPMNYLKKV